MLLGAIAMVSIIIGLFFRISKLQRRSLVYNNSKPHLFYMCIMCAQALNP